MVVVEIRQRFSRPCGEEPRWGLKTESIWVRGKGLPSYGKSNKIVKKKYFSGRRGTSHANTLTLSSLYSLHIRIFASVY